ncbi:MAG: hypothetical protein IPK14_13035 [Blastocatellia bacterium]|nr:hypothetical protein [Blastocatellia bacterium]
MNLSRADLFKIQLLTNYPKPGYEIWFSIVIDPVNQKAFWLRYTTFFPDPSLNLQPKFVLWGSFFDTKNASNHTYLAKSFSIDTISMSGDHYQHPSATLSLDKLTGNIASDKFSLSWQLFYQHQFEAFDYAPNLIKNSFLKYFVKAHSVACSPFAKVNGNITYKNQEYLLNNASAVLTHIWGSERIEQLFWVFAPIFDNDFEGWGVEIAIVKVKTFLPQITVVKILHNNNLYYDLSLLSVLSAKVRINYPELEIKARCKDFKVMVKARLNTSQITPYIYRNPDGKPFYIEQSDVSEIFCLIEKNGKKQELFSKNMAAVEFHAVRLGAVEII